MFTTYHLTMCPHKFTICEKIKNVSYYSVGLFGVRVEDVMLTHALSFVFTDAFLCNLSTALTAARNHCFLNTVEFLFCQNSRISEPTNMFVNR